MYTSYKTESKDKSDVMQEGHTCLKAHEDE